MRALSRALAVLAVAAAAAACEGTPTGSVFVPGTGGSVETPGALAFASTPSLTQQTPQTASGDTAGIDFAGTLATVANSCFTVAAAHVRSGNAVTVTVTGTAAAGICPQITYHNYTGRISNLQPGAYTLTIIHRAGVDSVTAFTGTVTVE